MFFKRAQLILFIILGYMIKSQIPLLIIIHSIEHQSIYFLQKTKQFLRSFSPRNMRQSESDSNFSIKMQGRKKLQQRRRRNNSKCQGKEFKTSAGKWCLNQIKLYIQFLKIYRNQINSCVDRRQIKIFKLMSIFIKTRTSDQCRSHHQKVQKIHPDIEEIISFYGDKIQTTLKKVQLHDKSQKQKQAQKDTDRSLVKQEQDMLFAFVQSTYGLTIKLEVDSIREF